MSESRLPDRAVDQEAYFRPEASWRKMLAMQPPVKMLRILQYGFSQEDPRDEDEQRLCPRKVMQMSQGQKVGGELAGVGLNVERRASGVMQWDIWDSEEITGEDGGRERDRSLYVIEGEEGMDSHTLAYVDWWMDRKAVAINDGREEEVRELQRMAGIII